MVTILNAVILGLVQGIAEFLPISSSGHLAIMQDLFGMTTAGEGHLVFDVLLHLGTLVSRAEDGTVTIELNGQQVSFPAAQVAQVRLRMTI